MMCRRWWFGLLRLGIRCSDQACQLFIVWFRRLIVMFVVGSRGRLGVQVSERIDGSRRKTS
jgi:hypothetical protein